MDILNLSRIQDSDMERVFERDVPEKVQLKADALIVEYMKNDESLHGEDSSWRKIQLFNDEGLGIIRYYKTSDKDSLLNLAKFSREESRTEPIEFGDSWYMAVLVTL